MSSIVVVSNYFLKNEYSEELKAYMRDLVPLCLAEDGCYQFDVHTNIEDPLHYVTYEQWASPEHFERHLKSEHILETFAKTKGMLDKITITKMYKSYE